MALQDQDSVFRCWQAKVNHPYWLLNRCMDEEYFAISQVFWADDATYRELLDVARTEIALNTSTQ
jgi:hypothetical protein